MPSSTSKVSSDTQSFLRTGPESALHMETRGQNEKEVSLQQNRATVFPAPAIAEEVRRQLEGWERFCALAVLLDSPAPAEDGGALSAVLEAILDRTAKEKSGLWFKWNAGLFGCALPDLDAAEAMALAHRIQKLLAERRVETISIGICPFPLMDYESPAILQNACKALDHAAFFGAGSVVIFDAVSLNISGDHYYQADQLNEALMEYQAALRMDPNNVNVHNSLGVCLAFLQDRKGARKAFDAALQIDADEAMAIFNLGMLDVLEDDRQTGLARFRQAYALESHTFEIPFQIGKLLTEQGSHEEAKNYLSAALKLRDPHAHAFSLMGQCLSALGQTREAIQALKKAVKLNPNDAAALSTLGMLYDQRGENPEICLTFCRQSVTLCPDDGLFRWRLALLHQRQNQLEAALAEYEAAAQRGYDAADKITEIQQLLASADDKKQCCA